MYISSKVASTGTTNQPMQRGTEKKLSPRVLLSASIHLNQHLSWLCLTLTVHENERYLEEYPDGGLFKGKNFVFDSRVAVKPQEHAPHITTTATTCAAASTTAPAADAHAGSEIDTNRTAAAKNEDEEEVVGHCIECNSPYDTFSGSKMCTVCRLPLLVCDTCATTVCFPGEYHCYRHRYA
jgi:hypothetical protein